MTGCMTILKLMWYICVCARALSEDKHFIWMKYFGIVTNQPFKIHGRYLEDGGTGGIGHQESIHHWDINKYLNALKLHAAAWWKTQS